MFASLTGTDGSPAPNPSLTSQRASEPLPSPRNGTLELGEKVRTPLNVHTLKELHHAVGIVLSETAFLTEVMCFCVCVHVFLSFDRPPHSFIARTICRVCPTFPHYIPMRKFQRRSWNGGQSECAKEWKVEGSQCQVLTQAEEQTCVLSCPQLCS